MKYQIGDKIIVLHSEEEGVVVDFINQDMIMIEVRGVKFPAYKDQIDFPYFNMFSKQRKQEKQKMFFEQQNTGAHTPKNTITEGVFLHFLPVFEKDIFDDEVVDKLKVYLVNKNEEAYLLKYKLFFLGEEHFSLNTSIDGLSELFLQDINFDDISDNPKFEFEFSLKNPNKKKAAFYETFQKINGKKLFKKIETLQQQNESFIKYEIFSHYPDKIDDDQLDLSTLGKAGFRMYEVGESRQHLPAARSVVDLHIEKLMDQFNHLSNFEILSIQLAEFEKYYELAVLHKLNEFTVIHGVGEGKLRDEIHELLKQKKEVKSYVNRYHASYGYGATEIFFN